MNLYSLQFYVYVFSNIHPIYVYTWQFYESIDIHMHIIIDPHEHIYIYIYTHRERERDFLVNNLIRWIIFSPTMNHARPSMNWKSMRRRAITHSWTIILRTKKIKQKKGKSSLFVSSLLQNHKTPQNETLIKMLYCTPTVLGHCCLSPTWNVSLFLFLSPLYIDAYNHFSDHLLPKA